MVPFNCCSVDLPIGIGSKFRNDDGSMYVICQVGHKKMSLINLTGFNRWLGEPVQVSNPFDLTSFEIDAIFGEYKGEFTYLADNGNNYKFSC